MPTVFEHLFDHLRRIVLRTWRSRVVRLSVLGTLIVIALGRYIDRKVVLEPALDAGARLEVAFTAIATVPERIILRWQSCDRDWRLYCLRPKPQQDEILTLAAYDLSNRNWLRKPIDSELSFRLDQTRDRWVAMSGRAGYDCFAYPARNLMDRAPVPPPFDPATAAPGEPPPPGWNLNLDISGLVPQPQFWDQLAAAGRRYRAAENDRKMLAEAPAPFDEKAFRELGEKLTSLGLHITGGGAPDPAALTRQLTGLYADFESNLAQLGGAYAQIRARLPSEEAATRVLSGHVADPGDPFEATASAAALHDFLFRPQTADKSARYAGLDAVLVLTRNAAKAKAKLALAEADLQMLELYRRLHILFGRDAAAWAPEPMLEITEASAGNGTMQDPNVLEAVTVAFEDRKDPTPRLPEVRACFPTGQTPWAFVPRDGFFGTVAFATASMASMLVNGVMGPIDAVAGLLPDDRLAGNLIIGSYLLIVIVSLLRLWRHAKSHLEILVGVPEILLLSAVWTFLGIVVGRWLFDELVAAVGITAAFLAWTPIYVALLVYPKMEMAVGFTLAVWTRARRAALQPTKPS